MKYQWIVLGGFLALLGTMASAKPDQEAQIPPAVFQKVVNCREIAGSAERLKCYDTEVAALDSAQKNNQLVVADREQLKEVKRGLFGFSLPKIKLFGGANSDEIKEIDSTIAAYHFNRGGQLVFTLADGARWQQIDNTFSHPKIGATVHIKHAALGSFFANIDGGRAIRAKRVADSN
ncbi:MAG: hypothetical protein ABGW87_13685 [Sphingomonadaceae bacterium]